MTQTTVIAPKLKKEWTPENFKTVEKAITDYFKRTYVTTEPNVALFSIRSFRDVDNCLGLAYTSSSSFAMYGVCNTQAYFDYGKHWHFVCFGLAEGNSGFVYALLHDNDENEIYFPIN